MNVENVRTVIAVHGVEVLGGLCVVLFLLLVITIGRLRRARRVAFDAASWAQEAAFHAANVGPDKIPLDVLRRVYLSRGAGASYDEVLEEVDRADAEMATAAA